MSKEDGEWASKLRCFFAGMPSTPSPVPGCTQTDDACDNAPPAVLSVQTDDDLENLGPQALLRPRSLVDLHSGERRKMFERTRSSSYSPRLRSAATRSASIGSETSTYRQRREEERRLRKQSDAADKGSGDEGGSPSARANGGAKRVADLRRSGSRVRASSESNLRTLERSASYSPARSREGSKDYRGGLKPPSVAQLFTSIDSVDVHGDSDSKSEKDESPSVSLWRDQPTVLLQKDSSEYVDDDPMTPEMHKEEPIGRSTSTVTSSDAGDMCTPLSTRVPTFFRTPPEAAATSRLSLSPAPLATNSSITPVRAARATSSGTSTTLFLSNCPGGGEPATPIGDVTSPPPLGATPLRDLMGTMDSCAVAERVQQSTLSMSPSEATDLLKYALVNFCDLGSDINPEERDRLENGIILTVNSLVERCAADVNAVDRDGNSLLSFILMHSHTSSVGDTNTSTTRGICALIRHLVYHGINIFTSSERMEVIHEGFLRLQADDLLWLSEMFRARCGITIDGDMDADKRKLSDKQYWNFLAVLVVTGQVDAAAFLLDLETVTMLPKQASALMKACKFETMDNPVETYEFLELHGGQL